MRPTLATINLNALRHNLSVVRTRAPQSKVMAVVKANGYGHGLLNAAQGLAGADGFAVLSLDEAIDLREAGYEHPILLLEGVFCEQETKLASSFNISVVVHCMQQITFFEKTYLINPISVFLKINTGMNRLGFAAKDFNLALARLVACKNAREITLMTHFANADITDTATVGVAKQCATFKEITQGLVYNTTLANSAAILCTPETHSEWVRPGIMLYGATPVATISANNFHLHPVMTLKSQIIGVQTLKQGMSAGYGSCFLASKATRIGIVACGYADGYPRHAGQLHQFEKGAPVAVLGRRTQTLGRVSMDMLFVDITDIPEANIGSTVELWGETVPVDEVATASGTIGYELLCAVASRVPLSVVE